MARHSLIYGIVLKFELQVVVNVGHIIHYYSYPDAVVISASFGAIQSIQTGSEKLIHGPIGTVRHNLFLTGESNNPQK